MTEHLDHPALEQALLAQDQDFIRRLFLYERDLRVRAETTLDGMQAMKIRSVTQQQAQPQTQQQTLQAKAKLKTENVKQTSLSLEELGL